MTRFFLRLNVYQDEVLDRASATIYIQAFFNAYYSLALCDSPSRTAKKTVRRQGKRDFIAARAFLPGVFGDISDYCGKSVKFLVFMGVIFTHRFFLREESIVS